MSKFNVVIPARYQSTRFPGKALHLLAGKPMIEYVYQNALASGADEIIIATDDARIETAAHTFGAEVCMTSEQHSSGTDRLAEVADQRGWGADVLLINLQGDEPLMPPDSIRYCAKLLHDDAHSEVATLASPLAVTDDINDPNTVKVVVDAQGRALYFSRATIPFCRDRDQQDSAHKLALRHHGIYAYRCDALRQIVAAPPSELEVIEQLEQLRAMWLGFTIRVGIVDEAPGPGVDTPEDAAKVQRLLTGLC